jgi:hypothetical protein
LPQIFTAIPSSPIPRRPAAINVSLSSAMMGAKVQKWGRDLGYTGTIKLQ